MIPAERAIARFRRDVTVGMVLNALLLAGIFFCVLLGGAFSNGVVDVLLLTGVLAVWLTLGYQSLRGQRLAAGSTSLIAAGQFEQAETQIEQALRTFSLFRTSKLLGLHHLAVLRHAQRRWDEAAELCRALLRTRLGNLRGLSRQSRLILADSLLEMGDLRGAHQAIAALYAERLTLAEALNLLGVQLDYGWRVHAWEAMLEGAATKVQLAELMNTANGARAQALMALAAKRLGREPWRQWLQKRVELLCDVRELVARRPVLAELWAEPSAERSAADPAARATQPAAPAAPQGPIPPPGNSTLPPGNFDKTTDGT
jgi:hypothetical protein